MNTRSKSDISKKKILHTTITKPKPDYLQTEPLSFTIASQIPEWTAAMQAEFDALQRQNTWSLVPPPSRHNVIGCRWVCKLKRSSDGSIACYKACLVAKGFHQQAGLDFDETFSPLSNHPPLELCSPWLHKIVATKLPLLHFPSLTNYKLHLKDLLSDPTPYRSLVGALQYATFTRPDITYALNQVCQYMHKPTATHLAAAKRILRYLQGTLHLGIRFQSGSPALTTFTDSDWVGDPYDMRSTTGITVFLGNNPITWVSKKQHTVSRSSTEAEYQAFATGAAELAWLRQVLCDLGIFLSSAPAIWCDNTNAIALASNPVFHSRTKHIEVDYHFVRECVVRGDLHLHFISTEDQLADLFTKPLSTPRFLKLTSKLMFSAPTHSLEGGY
uniref:Reverse transcriptase Ty1/copia-type domain-containing protein n=1 Tax=Fagus sylvatica TaxID=28930 RepID=A0A2N9IQH8_FAGSY